MSAAVAGTTIRPTPTYTTLRDVTLTGEGQRRLEAADPAIRGLRRAIERDFTPEDIATVKAWLVATAQRLERITQSRAA
jgi:hypothetical protein